ncbi:MAG: DUF5011 domain-containing protein [Erysipelotrichaceae bacterium]|nr:DUF5011 domain-containing protein [Erysipelotrichaceae bacterium]
MRMKLKGKIRYIIIFLICFITVVFLFLMQLSRPVAKEITIEAGSDISVTDFLKDKDIDGTLVTEITDFMMHNIGEYEVIVSVNNHEYTCMMNVVDTTAPTATSVDVEVYENKDVNIEDFVTDIDDATNVTLTLLNDISTETAGEYNMTIILADQALNTYQIDSTLTILVDEEAPVISGTANKKVVVGDTVSYKKDVTVTDNADDDIELKIDTSNVNLDEAGTYEVTYSATDSAGNTATETIKVYVVNDESDITEYEVYEKAQEVLDTIIDDSMSKREICVAIYNWVHNHMSYINSSDKSSWTKAAMYAFNNKKGDCYNYFAITKALLTQAGIENIDLSATKHTHYWNFVKVEEGWYHLDTTPRTDHPYLCLRTDAWMDAYSAKHSYCFSYDPDSKPASATE